MLSTWSVSGATRVSVDGGVTTVTCRVSGAGVTSLLMGCAHPSTGASAVTAAADITKSFLPIIVTHLPFVSIEGASGAMAGFPERRAGRVPGSVALEIPDVDLVGDDGVRLDAVRVDHR